MPLIDVLRSLNKDRHEKNEIISEYRNQASKLMNDLVENLKQTPSLPNFKLAIIQNHELSKSYNTLPDTRYFISYQFTTSSLKLSIESRKSDYSGIPQGEISITYEPSQTFSKPDDLKYFLISSTVYRDRSLKISFNDFEETILRNLAEILLKSIPLDVEI